MTVVDLEQHFIEQQIVNNRLKLGDSEIHKRVVAKLKKQVENAMKKSGSKLKGFHIQLYTTDEVFISSDLRFLPRVDPLTDAAEYYEGVDDDE